MALYGLILFVIYGWVEFEAMAHMVDAIGGLLSFLGIFATAIIGIQLLRHQSQKVMASMRADMARGQFATTAIASSLSVLLGAILMLIPGYVTDFMGLVCFIPGIRTIIGSFIAKHLASRTMSGFTKGGFASTFSNHDAFQAAFRDGYEAQSNDDSQKPKGPKIGDDGVIEGEFHEKK